jgi:hypothetical protein
VRSFEPRCPIIEVSFKPDERSVQQLAALIGGGTWREQVVPSGHDALDVIHVERQPSDDAASITRKPRGNGRGPALPSLAGR